GSEGKFYLFYVVACHVSNHVLEVCQEAASSLDAVVWVKTVSAVAIFGPCGRHKLTDTTSSSVGYCAFVIAGFLGEQCVQNGHGQASFFGGIFNSILILGWNATGIAGVVHVASAVVAGSTASSPDWPDNAPPIPNTRVMTSPATKTRMTPRQPIAPNALPMSPSLALQLVLS